MTSTITGSLPLHNSLSKNATTAHAFKDLKSASLISLGQLCDDNCQVQLDKDSLQVYKNDVLILQGHSNRANGLWDIPLSMPPLRQHANVIIHKNKPKVDLIKYLHACCYSPVPSTFIKAVKKAP
jgi:hypothetical protein